MNRVAVVVPAHDEQDLIGECLAALSGAPEIIVVADACRDDTAARAAAAGATVVEGSFRNVGQARAAGVAHALRHGPAGLWIACTDADTRVPAHWLDWQLSHAGADVLVGTVEVDDWSRWPAGFPALYEARYRLKVTGTAHGHVHGANLGFSAHAYLAAGGFPPVPVAEDRAFVSRARAAGARVVTDPSCPVRTSSRAVGRAPAGFAAHLSGLAAALQPGPPAAALQAGPPAAALQAGPPAAALHAG
ncbi:glycosyltransferase [Actinoplanes sp. RD1]|uniref:glycosyltransferase n=1 Tax=Actinoplanes sp. RD1 TaxID=3064538 RepID=UPI0027407A50|nr:glycosyltransferase [Actinoplanes sp. RD1]